MICGSKVRKSVKIINRMSYINYLVLLGLVICKSLMASSPPQIEWHRTYNGSGEESHPHYVIQTKDLGFLMVGETGFVENRTAKILLVKTDSQGNLIWKKEFGKRGYNLGNCVAESVDGNYLVAGSLGRDAALIQVEADTGKTLWLKTWNMGTEDAFEGLTITPEGGILVTGYRDGLAEGTFMNWGRGVVLKTDSTGREEWRRELGEFASSGYRVKATKDKGSLLMCHPRDEESNKYHLLKLDHLGKVVWSKYYNTVYWGFDTKANGYAMLAGHTQKSPLSKNWDIELTVVDERGSVVWTRFFGQPRGYEGKWIHDEVWGARSTMDGGWLAVAGTGDETGRYEKTGHISGPSGQWKIYLIKVDENGETEWEGIYGATNSDWAGEDVCVTADGGALIANDCGSFGFTKIARLVKKEN
jgi:hypothetical protein